ncbi:MAG: acyltransferase family protein, partial [Lachnospiraceae bacterium]
LYSKRGGNAKLFRFIRVRESVVEKRNYGIDVLRMLAMFMVTILHILTQGGILNASSKFTSQYEVGWLLQTAAFCAVDVYALISGYVWVHAKYRYRNIIELWMQVLFYSVSITVIFRFLVPSSAGTHLQK